MNKAEVLRFFVRGGITPLFEAEVLRFFPEADFVALAIPCVTTRSKDSGPSRGPF